jgi:PAS domain S-box-containing protein
MRLRQSLITDVGVRILGFGAIAIGLSWLCFWFSGVAPRWSAEGVNTVKTNMALCQVLAGAALLLLAPSNGKPLRQRLGMLAGGVVFLIGALTLSEHLFSYNLGIDQLLASERPGAVGTASPNRIGPPGSSSLMLLGLGLLSLAFQRPRLAAWLALGVCVINLIPAVGFLYGIEEFYKNPRLTGIAWSTVIALLSVAGGLMLARPEEGPVAQLLREDAGGVLLRRLVPAVILIPFVLGFLRVQGQQRGFYDTAAGTGALTILVVVGFLFILWRTAGVLSRTAEAKAKVEGEVRSVALFPEENPFPVLRVRDDGTLLYANRSALRLLEVWQCTVGGSVPESIREVMRKARREGSREELEVQVAGRELRLTAMPIEGRDYINIYGTDLTERKRAEAELRESQVRFSTLAQQAPAGIFETDASGDCLFVNEYWQDMTGLSAAQAAGKGWSQGIHPDDRERVFAEWSAAAAAQREFASEYRFRTPAGKVSWVMGNAKPIRDAKGKVIRYLGTVLDLTERKKAERLGMLEEVFRQAPSFLHVLRGPKFIFEFANEAYYRLVGHRDLIGRPAFEAMPEAAEGGYPERIARVMATGEAFFGRELPVTLARTAGAEPEERIIDLVYLPLKDADGTCSGVLGHGTDVTEHVRERKRAEEALEESAARMARAQAIAHLGSWEFDTRNNQLTWSDETYRIFGFEPQSFRPSYEAFLGAVHPKDRAAVDARYSASVREGKDGYEMEHRVVRAGTGEVRIVHEKCQHLRDESGRVVRSQGMVHDITERKRAEEALERSQARLMQGVRVAGLGIFEHDHLTDMIELSRVMRELLGFGPEEEVTIAAIIEKVVPEDREELAARIARAHDPAGEGQFEVDYRVPAGPGRVRWVSARSQTFFHGEGKERRAVRTIGAALNVTDRKESEARLERVVAERTAKLQELVGELEHFSYTITHDMRAPLRAMQGFSEMLDESWGSWREEEAKGFLKRIRTSTARMDALITDALNYSKTVRQELALSPVDVGALLRGMLDSYPEFQPSKARIDIEGEIPLVIGNEAGLTQCFSNLLGNAVKFVKPGEKARIKIWAEVVAEGHEAHGGFGGGSPGHGNWVRMWVEDKGVGIPESMLSRVFDLFARGHQSYEGTGIGLALVRKVVQRMGGRVGVKSVEGEGSRFWVELRPGDVRSAK